MINFSFFWKDAGFISIYSPNIQDAGDTGWAFHLFPGWSFWGWGRREYFIEGEHVVDICVGFLFRYVRVGG